MTPSLENLLFAAASVLALSGGVGVALFSRNRALILSAEVLLLGGAGLLALLGAGNLAAVLIMLTVVVFLARSRAAATGSGGAVRGANRAVAAAVASVVFLTLLLTIVSLPTPAAPSDSGASGWPIDGIRLLLSRHLLALGVALALLFAAAVGARAIRRAADAPGEGR